MNAESELALQAHEKVDARSVTGPNWRIALLLLIAACLGILLIYRPTAESLVAIWERSETFAHGFLILPISLFLIWRKRRELAQLTPSPDVLGLVVLAAAGAAWLVAAAGQVQVVQQYALVTMLVAVVIAVTGREVARTIAFPLGFLFLGVPIGEALIPPLMNWTAHFTVVALRLTGIPVFEEGTFFTIPSGHWSVVEGCSGLRYLIASITVGVLFAYLNYSGLRKRLWFILASIIVPIIANGLRAYMIVMIADLSDMKLALGVDHLIYGWLFFGLVMLLLFWVGSFWRDPLPAETGTMTAAAGPIGVSATPSLSAARTLADVRAEPARVPRTSQASLIGIALAVLAIGAVWVLYSAHLDRVNAAKSAPVLASPAPAAGWSLDSTQLTDWRPHYQGAAASLFETWRKGDHRVAVYLGYYRNQRRGAELVTSTNIMIVQKHPVWNNMGDGPRIEDLGNGPVEIRQTKLRSPVQRLLTWDWYRLAGRDLTNPYLAKLLLARDRLLDRGDDAAAIILAAPYDDRPQEAAEVLQQFVREMLPSINATLIHVGGAAMTTGR